MKNMFTEEMIERAEQTKTVDELETLTKEQLEKAFENTHPRIGKLADDELDNIAGGACGNSVKNPCPNCGKALTVHHEGDDRGPDSTVYATCSCGYDSRY